MLRGLRKASSSWLGKLVMAVVVGFLIIAFGIWGIGDMLRSYGRSTLAKVGSTEIGIEQFRQSFNERLRQLGQRLNRPITPDQARALGLDRQLLGETIAEAALDERARQLGLNLSDEEVARQIRADPNFRGPGGQFDRLRFEQLIRNIGFTEARYAAEQRRTSLRREVASTISGQMVAPKTIADAVNRYQNEERTIEYVLLDSKAAGEIEAPTPEVLQKYFDDRKAAYRAPEYRKAVVLPVSAAELARSVDVSDADARRFYDSHRDRYGSPERRQLQQIVFPNAEEARAAAERIAAGTAFAAIATERGLKEQDIDLGLVAKSGIFDRAVADAAFGLSEGGTSAPIAGRFGTTLVHVVKIQPAEAKPFEEVAADIKKDMALERAKPKVLDTHDKIEDERASGMRLDEVAKKLNLSYRTIEAIDRSGRDPNGQPVGDVPANLVSALFTTDVGVDANPLQLPGGGFVWYDVVSITASRERSLDDVKDKVEAQWRDDQVAQRLAAKATEMVDKLKSEAPFPDVAGAVGATVQTLWGLKRGRASGPVSAKAIDAVFHTAKGAPGSAEGNSPTERIVFRVTDIIVPTFDAGSADSKKQLEALQRSLSDDIFGLYVARLESELGTSINEDALRRATGSSDTDAN
jgi:peptidyl-prolyl cis-trans isomerase D